MKRQNIRKLMLIISLLLFPITVWYMSPYIIIRGAMEGIISGSAIVFLCMLVMSILLGRSFCGWICPMGCLQEGLIHVQDKKPSQGWRNYIKYVIWTLWLGAIATCFILGKAGIKINPFYMTDHGISIAEIGNYIIYYGVIFLVLIPSVLFGKRIFCHYFCWMAPFMVAGTKLRRLFKLPGLHVKGEQNKCIGCQKCNHMCSMSIDIMEAVKSNKDLGAECIQCGMCVDNCPKGALSFSMKGDER